jgi:hypothetical protein
MIQMPQRSIFRFFIPMIDVLTLLFCIFMVMLSLPETRDPESEKISKENEERLRELEELVAGKDTLGDQSTAQLREELEKLRKEKIQTLKGRIAVRVLEIDALTGALIYRDPQRVEIRDQAEALRLIESDHQRQGVSKKELYYLILYPRDKASGFPTREQRQRYDRWFEGVPLGYDIPGIAAGTTSEKQP